MPLASRPLALIRPGRLVQMSFRLTRLVRTSFRAIGLSLLPPLKLLPRVFLLEEICQIASRVFRKNFFSSSLRWLTLRRCRRQRSQLDAFSASSLPLTLLSSPGVFPQSFPVALELRRVGVGHRWRITVGAEAAELQGPWLALEPRPRLSSVFPLPSSVLPLLSSFQPRADLVQTSRRVGPGERAHAVFLLTLGSGRSPG